MTSQGVKSAGQPDTARPTNGGAGSLVVRVTLGGEIQLQGEEPEPMLTGRQCAELLGVKPSTWRVLVRDGYAPPADDKDLDRPEGCRLPRWRLSTFETFKANRPGRGRGPRGHKVVPFSGELG